MEIQNFDDFVTALLEAGFSTSSGNAEGVFAVITWNWLERAPYKTPVRWHTGDPDTDPWEWRERVLDERSDVAYGKLFFRKGGYITREWYPYFFAVRRGGRTFNEEYRNGHISQSAKRIYRAIEKEGALLPVHLIKQAAGFGREDKSRFDGALIELQMKMFITICGRQHKLSEMGLQYGWPSTVFCKTEDFFDEDVYGIAAELSADDAEEKIMEQIFKLNPAADPAKALKFIRG